MSWLVGIGLLISHGLLFLVGRAIETNKVLDKHYPGYREYKQKQEK